MIELLVVIAIIAILAAILFPVFAIARERARATSCLSNSKQLATAYYMYTQDYDEYQILYATRNAANTGWAYGWQYPIMSYVKSSQVFVCPSARKGPACASTSCDPTYVAPGAGFGSGSYGYNYYYLGNYISVSGVVTANPVSLAALQKPAETVAFTEITGLASYGATYSPPQWSVAYTAYGGQTYGDQIAEWHMEGNNIVFCDGHAKWMKKSMLADYNRDGVRDSSYANPNWFSVTK